MEKKIYEEPSVTKVEFDFNECIAASTSSKEAPAETCGGVVG